MPSLDTDTAYQNVRLTMKAATDWLHANIGDPNRDATSWRSGEWNIEIHYTLGEGTLQIWTDSGWPGRRLITRGRNDADIQLWMDTLEACKP
jgi:hypothetical protein